MPVVQEVVTTLPELSTPGPTRVVRHAPLYPRGIANKAEYYDYSKPGVLEATVNGEQMGLGHFTQLVWKATTKIGCAAVTCADGTLFTGYGDVSLPSPIQTASSFKTDTQSTFVVCEYESAGNVYLEGDDSAALFVENVGEKVA